MKFGWVTKICCDQMVFRRNMFYQSTFCYCFFLSTEAGVLKNFGNFTGKYLLLIKLQEFRSETLFKKDSNMVFSCEIWEIFKNTWEEHLETTASIANSFTLFLSWKRLPLRMQFTYHIKWNTNISSSLRLLLKVWI